jgi:hypothetical protein
MANILPNKRKQKKLVTQAQVKKAFEVGTFKQLCHGLGYDPGLFLVARRQEMEDHMEYLEEIVAGNGGPGEMDSEDAMRELAAYKRDAMAIDFKVMEYVYSKQRAVETDVKSDDEPIRLVIEG